MHAFVFLCSCLWAGWGQLCDTPALTPPKQWIATWSPDQEQAPSSPKLLSATASETKLERKSHRPAWQGVHGSEGSSSHNGWSVGWQLLTSQWIRKQLSPSELPEPASMNKATAQRFSNLPKQDYYQLGTKCSDTGRPVGDISPSNHSTYLGGYSSVMVPAGPSPCPL